MSACPCGSGRELAACCGPYLAGDDIPKTAEALMRSRFTAYTLRDFAYLERTVVEGSRSDFEQEGLARSTRQVTWKSLEVHSSSGGEEDQEGEVVFTARFEKRSKPYTLHERSRFVREGGLWRYHSGEALPGRPYTPNAERVGRNAPCPCGSGKKYKKCCGRA